METEYDYNHIVSLGYNCEVTNGILEVQMRDAAYPFDWIFSKMWKINEMLRTRFSNFFLKENLIVARYKKNPAKEKDNGFIYVHDGPYDILCQDNNEYINAKEKYNRRILRLLEILDSGKSVLFVRVVYDDIIDEHLDFVNILSNLYPNSKFHLLVFCPNTKIMHVEHEKIEYVSGIKIGRYCLGGFLRTKYNLPTYKSIKKEY
jgi:hypothetical protein